MRKLYICIYLSLPTYGFILTKLQQSGGGVMGKHSSTLQIMCSYRSYSFVFFYLRTQSWRRDSVQSKLSKPNSSSQIQISPSEYGFKQKQIVKVGRLSPCVVSIKTLPSPEYLNPSLDSGPRLGCWLCGVKQIAEPGQQQPFCRDGGGLALYRLQLETNLRED